MIDGLDGSLAADRDLRRRQHARAARATAADSTGSRTRLRRRPARRPHRRPRRRQPAARRSTGRRCDVAARRASRALDGLAWTGDGYAVGQRDPDRRRDRGRARSPASRNAACPLTDPFPGCGRRQPAVSCSSAARAITAGTTLDRAPSTSPSRCRSLATAPMNIATSSLDPRRTRLASSPPASSSASRSGSPAWPARGRSRRPDGDLHAHAAPARRSRPRTGVAPSTVFGYDLDLDGGVAHRRRHDHGLQPGSSARAAGPRRPELAARRLRRHVAGRRLVPRPPVRRARATSSARSRSTRSRSCPTPRTRTTSGSSRSPTRTTTPATTSSTRSALFAGIVCDATCCNLPTVGFTAYGGAGNDLIIGSQAGDHLAGGSGDDEIHGGRGVDHIYGDSGVNVEHPHARARRSTPSNAQPAADARPDAARTTARRSSRRRRRSRDDLLIAGRDLLYGEGAGTVAGGPQSAYDDIIFGDHGAVIQQTSPTRTCPTRGCRRSRRRRSPRCARDRVARRFQNGDDDVDLRQPRPRHRSSAAPATTWSTATRPDDLVFGDNVVPDALRGDDGDARDDITSLRFQTLGRHAALQPHRPAGRRRGFADAERRQQRPAARRRRRRATTATRTAAPWWAEYAVDYADLHTFAIRRRAARAPAASATTTSPAARATT